MSDFFNALLHSEIIEAGRIPDSRVVERSKEIFKFLEPYFENDLNVLKPLVSSHSDIIIFNDLANEIGFSIYIYIDKSFNRLEEELTFWNREENLSINIKGSLTKQDFKLVFERE